MKQAIFHRDYGVERRPFGEGKIICEKLLQNLEFQRAHSLSTVDLAQPQPFS
jgi:hypothetical protein